MALKSRLGANSFVPGPSGRPGVGVPWHGRRSVCRGRVPAVTRQQFQLPLPHTHTGVQAQTPCCHHARREWVVCVMGPSVFRYSNRRPTPHSSCPSWRTAERATLARRASSAVRHVSHTPHCHHARAVRPVGGTRHLAKLVSLDEELFIVTPVTATLRPTPPSSDSP